LFLFARSFTNTFLQPSADLLINPLECGATADEAAAAAFAAALSALAATRLTTNPGRNTPVPAMIAAGLQYQ
jgi:hypothetical protein